MPDVRAELSALQTQLDEIVERVAEAAARALEARDEGLAADLYEAERSLAGASRRLRSAAKHAR